jgi:hypothetical protein
MTANASVPNRGIETGRVRKGIVILRTVLRTEVFFPHVAQHDMAQEKRSRQPRLTVRGGVIERQTASSEGLAVVSAALLNCPWLL